MSAPITSAPNRAVDEFRYSVGERPRPGRSSPAAPSALAPGFSRASIPLGDTLTSDVGGRVDSWNSTPHRPGCPTQSVDFFSPRAAVAWRAARYALQAAAYHANRPPTLNELHRGFRAGNVVTNPNPLLEPETLTGVEGGVLTPWTRVSRADHVLQRPSTARSPTSR